MASADNTSKRKKITQILAEETGGKSYKAHKYSLDSERSTLDYNETEDRTFFWKKRGETEPPITYKSLESLAKMLAARDEQVLTYFLDGSRHVYKVDDMAYSQSGDRSVIYPTIAGQVGVGICKRENKQMMPEILTREIIISIPSIADPSGKGGFFESLSVKLNESNELARIKQCGWKFSTPVPYDTKQDERKFEDRGTARIQEAMIEREKEMVKKLVREGKLNQDNYLVKDGSLEYRLTKTDKDDDKSFQTFRQNYNWVIGVSKSFNPEACFDKGKANPGLIADLPLYHRTPVAYFGSEKEPLAFAVWYVRLRDKGRTRTPFDGILKVEKILVRDDEIKNGMETETVDRLSALLINERNPTCYGTDIRWANHIYPIYLTERFIKSQYLSVESFLHLF
ncbi:hypothetical protein SAMN05660649_00880 [Desulfotomaculum arcticum]|uniref:NurA domain-containing protein n=1 Tax=Desulfotruncus arcticus DSM 17038 TaxID=1121424 RepID=A0A1I2PH95_9FIRM|nr:hypothetical protein [Desulfotruncus arcticus]SFG14920.1 hypothetical protein SAMN05660649_00880 [Desulfotomaculum arcticum] [Desulfotruncus arcticus DSM 17038]